MYLYRRVLESRYVVGVVLVLIFALVAFWGINAITYSPINSDTVANFLLFPEFGKYKVFSSYHMFFARYFIYVPIWLIWGFTLKTLWVSMAINFGLFVLANGVLFWFLKRKGIITNYWVAGLVFMWVLTMFPLMPYVVYTFGRGFEVPIVTLVTLWALYKERFSLKAFVGLIAFYTFVHLSDPYYFLSLLLPALALWWGLYLLGYRRYSLREGIKWGAIFFIPWGLGHLIRGLIARWFNVEYLGFIGATISSFEKIPYKLALTLQSLTHIFDAYIWGHSVASVEGIRAWLGAGVLGLTLGFVGVLAFRYLRLSRYVSLAHLTAAYLVLVWLVSLAAYILFDNVVDIGSSRYIVVLPLLTPVVFGVTYEHLSKLKRFWVAVFLAIGAGVAFKTLLFSRTFTLNYRYFTPPNYAQILEVLNQNQVKKAYAEYWYAASLTYLSQGAVLVAPVSCSGVQVTPYPVWASQRWYEPQNTSKTAVIWPHNISICSVENLPNVRQVYSLPNVKIAIIEGDLAIHFK